MGTVRFFYRLEKIDKHGQGPVDLIYQVHGRRKFFRTKIRLYPANWSLEKQLAVYYRKPTSKEIKAGAEDLAAGVHQDSLLALKEVEKVNAELVALRKRVADIEDRFKGDEVAYSSEMVIAKLNEAKKPQTKKEDHTDYLISFIDKYIADHKTTREANSLKIYSGLKNHLQGFAKHTRRNISFAGIDYTFFQQFQNYLIAEKLRNTTVAKQLSTLKTFIGYAKKQGIAVSDKYKEFTIKREKLEVIALTNAEFEKLYSHDFEDNVSLAQVRDVFCFACATGLRYSDLYQLRREHIKNDEIILTIKKTKQQLSIPLNPYSIAILDKYKAMHRPLPVISNQKMNEYLKKACTAAEINEQVEIVRFRGAQREVNLYAKHELIGVHTARKTFVTLSLEKGMSAEEVMSISGHSDYKSFQRYVKITQQRQKVVMRKAWGEVAGMLKAV